MVHLKVLTTLVLVVSLPGTFGQASRILCKPGELNVILAAPHGGYDQPEDIADRDAGCYIDGACVWSHNCGEKDHDQCGAVTDGDSFTQELTHLISRNLFEKTGLRPTSVFNLLARVKLDANRDINEATFGEQLAVEAWEEFHRCINESKVVIEEYVGAGLFLDIHGHGHPIAWAELGYLLTASELDNDDFESSDTSIYHLSTLTTSDFDTLLRGDLSFGYFLEAEGYESVPSPSNPGPDGESYFSGGYNTRIHGSRDGGVIDAIQIESAYENREFPEREHYANAIANAIINYMEAHYPARKIKSSKETCQHRDESPSCSDKIMDEKILKSGAATRQMSLSVLGMWIALVIAILFT